MEIGLTNTQPYVYVLPAMIKTKDSSFELKEEKIDDHFTVVRKMVTLGKVDEIEVDVKCRLLVLKINI